MTSASLPESSPPANPAAPSSDVPLTGRSVFMVETVAAGVAVRPAFLTEDGRLPDWLKFVPGERRFVGTAPPNVGQVSVVVTARDERGEQVSTSITLNFGN